MSLPPHPHSHFLLILFQLLVYTKQFEIFYDILVPLELCKSPSKVPEMAFQRLYSFKIFQEGMPPGPPRMSLSVR
jgi:hypothetical protein